MLDSKLTAQEYKKYLEINNQESHLLVEGKNDSSIFESLFNEILGVDWYDERNLKIDNAERLISSDDLKGGNRERVEKICETYKHNNLIGFVDREFRKFQVDEKIIDEIKTHYRTKNLVWSRGHSLENYYFEIGILQLVFHDVCGDEFDEAYKLFSKNINSYIRTAGVLSLIGHNFNQFERIKRTIGWKIFTSKGELDISNWEKEISSHTSFTQDDINQIKDGLPRLISLINDTEIETIKWLCHGHIGSSVLWMAFARCIYDVIEIIDNNDKLRQKGAQAFLKYQNDKLAHKLFGQYWAKAAAEGIAEYPSIIFELLNIG